MTLSDNQSKPRKKDCHWIASSKDDLREMPEDVRYEFGQALLDAQWGGRADCAKPLSGFDGASVLELKDDFDSDTYRCVYTVQFGEAIYVLHVFQKKSKTGAKTPKRDIELIKSRLKLATEDYKSLYGVSPITADGKKGNKS